MKLTYIGNKIDNMSIQKLEELVKEKIPTDYCSFLLENNGGMPEEDYVFDFSEPDNENNGATGSDLHYFFNVEQIREWYSNLIHEELIPQNLLPIACDSFDNAILLNLEPGSDFGTVWFADHESTKRNAPFWTIVKVANSFSDFLVKLRPMFDE